MQNNYPEEITKYISGNEGTNAKFLPSENIHPKLTLKKKKVWYSLYENTLKIIMIKKDEIKSNEPVSQLQKMNWI